MTKATLAGVALAGVLVLVAGSVAYLALNQKTPHLSRPSASATTVDGGHPSFLYGRVTLDGGATREGRLRWGQDQEAFWSDYFNGAKAGNPWAAYVPRERNPPPIEIFGVEIATRGHLNLSRPFLARFGDIARLESAGRDIRVTLKSGTAFDVDWNAANDFADGVRVWDRTHGVVDLGSGAIRVIEFLAPPDAGVLPDRLHGTVKTRQRSFTGFIQWGRHKGLRSDAIDGRTADGALSLSFEAIQSIARQAGESALVTQLDGGQLSVAGIGGGVDDALGIYVDDPRYGRVVVAWDAFERVEFTAGGTGPSYGDFPPGRPLTGAVTTRDGRRLAGRLVYDLDESETTETLDAPSGAVDYAIPFGLIGSIEMLDDRPGPGASRAKLTLHDGEELQLERRGDLGDANGGLLVFPPGQERPEYISWTDVRRIELDRRAP